MLWKREGGFLQFLVRCVFITVSLIRAIYLSACRWCDSHIWHRACCCQWGAIQQIWWEQWALDSREGRIGFQNPDQKVTRSDRWMHKPFYSELGECNALREMSIRSLWLRFVIPQEQLVFLEQTPDLVTSFWESLQACDFIWMTRFILNLCMGYDMSLQVFFETLDANFISPLTWSNRESQMGLQTPGGCGTTPF